MRRLLVIFILQVFIGCSDDNDDCIKVEPGLCASITCSTEYNPVCGCDGNTYTNDCLATCSGVTSFSVGECR